MRQVHIFSTSEELAGMIKDISLSGRHALTLESTTILSHNKYDRKGKGGKAFIEDFPKGEIFCTKKEYVSLCLDYEDAVNKQRIKEGKDADFESAGLKWGEFIGTARTIIAHKDKFYLRYVLHKNANYSYSERIHTWEDGTLVPKDKMDLFWDQYKTKKSESTRQGTDIQIEVRNVKLEGVTRMVVDGKVYVRKDYEQAEDLQSIYDFHMASAEIVRKKLEALQKDTL